MLKYSFQRSNTRTLVPKNGGGTENSVCILDPLLTSMTIMLFDFPQSNLLNCIINISNSKVGTNYEKK